MLMGFAYAASSNADLVSNGQNSIVIVFKDGHQQTFAMSDIARIEFPGTSGHSAAASRPGHFVGKWEVGDGVGGTFTITLSRNGTARKSKGPTQGRWTEVDNEARISWDDSWHDAIRKTGEGYEKRAFEPGKSFSDDPSNVAVAKKTDPI